MRSDKKKEPIGAGPGGASIIEGEITKRLDHMFFPKSVALIGASDVPGKWGFMILTDIIGGDYSGMLYPVNPKKETILGLPCYARVQDIPDEVDLAVISVPAKFVPAALKDCAEKNIHAAVVVTSGFREVGAEGRKLEDEIITIAREGGISFVGPNTMGIVSKPGQVVALGAPVFPSEGDVALISQSGNVGIQFIQWCTDKDVGINYFAGVGNEAVLSAKDYLTYFAQREDVKTIAMYMEGVSGGREFMQTAKKVTQQKPVIVLKSGRSAKGSQAASSHTGAMAGSYATCRSMFRQCGVVEVDSPVELINVSAAMSCLPIPRSNRVGVVTFGGGWGVITADACERSGLELPNLPPSVIQEIDGLLPEFWNRSNPVDLVGESGENVLKVLEVVAKWEEVDAIIALGLVGVLSLVENFVACQKRIAGTPVSLELKSTLIKERIKQENRVFAEVVRLQNEVKKPIINVTLGASDVKTLVKTPYGKALCLTSPEEATNVLSYMSGYSRYLASLKPEKRSAA